MTTSSPGSRLVDAYDLVIFDLDGVIYLVDRPIETAVAAVGRLHAEGKPLAYATNNASRRPAAVAALLSGMGLAVQPHEVLTSAVAAAGLLANRFPADSPVLVVGAEALRAEVRAVGLRPVRRLEDEPVAVVQGYAPEVGWADLAEAALAVRAGAEWFATNTDRTLPTARGPVPGNGSLVAVLRTALERDPDVVVGKPEPALFTAAARQAGATRPLTVGDRLDTDIEGAVRAGLDSLLVLTGVTRPVDLLHAPLLARPTYVATDLGGLFDPAQVARLPGPAPEEAGSTASGPAATGSRVPGLPIVADNGWQVTANGETAQLTGSGSSLEALATLCAAAWSGRPVDSIEPGSDAARSALGDLDLLR
ncbi:HAD-IIA family hydrolase [Plantactinospora soyae]|uniref:HAD superfamily hydrolase (TIGR01450 family) n=1 Tax=Plantactinospora soyae TaxID=1544732 RepID=A0A927R0W8_9ACTN|nr:HAD-IIA family hydrolase [Plantactinospora soyae]MBE1489088.1 HAD superfamily hydrolase (TIGR01450 family) [Plantactinospora soyae]